MLNMKISAHVIDKDAPTNIQWGDSFLEQCDIATWKMRLKMVNRNVTTRMKCIGFQGTVSDRISPLLVIMCRTTMAFHKFADLRAGAVTTGGSLKPITNKGSMAKEKLDLLEGPVAKP